MEKAFMLALVPEPRPKEINSETWLKAQLEDADIQDILKKLKEGKIPWYIRNYHVQESGILYYHGAPKGTPRVEVPSSLRERICQLTHEEMSHHGRQKMLSVLQGRVHWKGMSTYVKTYLSRCIKYLRRKTPRPQREGMFKNLQCSAPGEVYYMDYVSKTLPRTPDGFVYALVVIDGFTRFPWVIPLRNKEPATVARGLFEHVFSTVGLPKRIHCDNDFTLTSRILQELFSRWGVRQSFIAFRHPASNGVAERFMRYLNSALTTCLPSYQDWPQTITIILFAYRNVIHASTGFTPAFLTLGRDPLLPIDMLDDKCSPLPSTGPVSRDATEFTQQLTARLKDAFKRARIMQEKVQARNAEAINERRFEAKYNVGDQVLLWDPKSSGAVADQDRAKPLPSSEFIENIPDAWKYKWSGPHTVQKKISDTMYQIFHSTRRVFITVNVDHMMLIEKGDTSQPSLPPNSKTLPEPKAMPTPGEFCALRLNIAEEPLVIAKYLGYVSEDDITQLLFQWCGSYSEYKYPDPEVRIYSMQWKLGWLQPSDQRFYWKPRRDHPSHIPFTNVLSGHSLTVANILIHGFQLTPDCKVNKKTANQIILQWRSLPEQPATNVISKDDL
jgi:hypothetical protein